MWVGGGVGVGWGMYERSHAVAHEVDATLWMWGGACMHVHMPVHHCKVWFTK